jgi:hypothetical protein
MFNFHTCTACRMNLVTSMILVTNDELFKMTCDIIGSTRVHVLILIHGVEAHSSNNMAFLWDIVFIKPMPAVNRRVSCLEADLTDRAPIVVMGRGRSSGEASTLLILALWLLLTTPTTRIKPSTSAMIEASPLLSPTATTSSC